MSADKLNIIISAPAKRAALEKRFWSKVDRRGPDDCWPWVAKAKHKHGYGMMVVITGFVDYSHRLAFALIKGPILDGAVIRHRCDNPPCCNPRHLVSGTHTDNHRDMMERGRHVSAFANPEVHRKAMATKRANPPKRSRRQEEAAKAIMRERWADPEWRKRWSENMSGERNPTYGRRFRHTDEARKKISESQIGRKHSPETKQKMRVAAQQREARRRQQLENG